MKLRRMWRYVAYDTGAPGFVANKQKNLFGRVEEARDADGLRFFEYDWRGLVTKASHRFWPQTDGLGRAWNNTASTLWSTGTSWDPAVVSTARASVTSWLTLSNLTDTTTIAVTTTWDAAGRPTEVVYPQSLKVRQTYNAAGLLDELERDTGSGYGTVASDFTYNARGQNTGYTHGNGVVTEREYDADIERITRIYTYLPGSPKTEFQDLAYDYDPVGNPLQITDNLTSSSFAANKIIPNTRTFRYDPRYRLVRATGKKRSTITNWWDDPLTPNPTSGQYTAYDYDYAYDEVGNVTTNEEQANASMSYKATRIDLYNGNSTEATNTDPTLGNWRYDANGNAPRRHATRRSRTPSTTSPATSTWGAAPRPATSATPTSASSGWSTRTASGR